MAKLTEEILTKIFALQRRLVELIDEAKATELSLFEHFGETEATISDLEQLQNVAERLRNPYSRLHTLLLRVAEYQPTAPAAILNLLAETIKETEATVDAAQASTPEIKKDWNLL